ncbi:MAG: DUF1501 domain-containing protein [Planctomycetota bacterium]|nr:MAG: DUF1501 domain-containing protein [Planctomycetota bacterium]
MIHIGNFNARNCQGISRRSFLQAGAALPFAMGLPFGAGTATAQSEGRAKSVLLVWLGGGPSHLDLFDPKPKAPQLYRGPFAPLQTRTPGAHFSELLPKLAAGSDQFSVIRTNVNFDGGHRPAGSIALTGAVAPDGGEDRGGKPGQYPPNFGSILARHRGEGELPGFVSLARGPIGDGVGPIFGYGGGKWGKGHDPFMLSCSESGEVSIPALELPEGLSPPRLTDRRAVLEALDESRRTLESPESSRWDAIHRRAYAMLTSSSAGRAFDLSEESDSTRNAYGHTSFGQSCLLGRRLVEAGIPYVQVNWSQYVEVLFPFSDYGWDTHSDNFGLLADWHGPLLDRVVSVLLSDLQDRGLLDSTLLLVMGEFGRTPRINSIGSRDHWHHCYFSLWAGGGVQPGRIIGESDPNGEHPITNPVTPAMVGTTVLELAGMTTADRASQNVLEGGRVIDELL